MGLMDYASEDFKELVETEKVEKRERILEKEKESNTDYVSERNVEMICDKPEPLEHFSPVNTKVIETLLFAFNKQEWDKVKDTFKILNYVETNCTENWIMEQFCDLVTQEKITIDRKHKKVIINE